jgi:hypothetical protein
MIADYLVELEKRIEALEKEIAELKVRVSERPEVQTDPKIIGDLIILLQATVDKCFARGTYDSIVPIAKMILELITWKRSLLSQ